jgi:hypothetical protein
MLKLACCGLQCEGCPVFIATLKNDDALRQKTAREWTKLFADFMSKKELAVEDMNCQGCQSENGCRFIGCQDCIIRKCCEGKNFSTCAECAEYESCPMINGFFTVEQHKPAKLNLDNIRLINELPGKKSM